MAKVSTSPIDTDGIVRCFAHRLEASFKTSYTHTNPANSIAAKKISRILNAASSSANWADQIEELSKMSSTPRKRSSTSGSQPETPSQKRLRLIQETLGQASNDEDGSSLLMTPPSTNHKPASARFFTREESPTPLPGPSASHNFLSTVDYSVSQELYSLTQSLQGLQPDIERLERLNSAANKTTNIKTDRIKQLEAENEILKQTIADREEEIKDLKKMNKALLDTRTT